MQRLTVYLVTLSMITSGVLGVVWQRHYCQNELKSSALWVKPKSCHEVDQGKTCPKHASAVQVDANEHERGCCDNQIDYLTDDTDQIHVVAPLPVEMEHASPPAGYLTPVVHIVLPLRTEYLNYKPPLLFRDPVTELQVFLC
ncbi:MAG: hypothetical protein R3301_02005 [Saprospiraceae bacterium]|nr:hypothetical protein [Saprospiraceae bacterium]